MRALTVLAVFSTVVLAGCSGGDSITEVESPALPSWSSGDESAFALAPTSDEDAIRQVLAAIAERRTRVEEVEGYASRLHEQAVRLRNRYESEVDDAESSALRAALEDARDAHERLLERAAVVKATAARVLNDLDSLHAEACGRLATVRGDGDGGAPDESDGCPASPAEVGGEPTESDGSEEAAGGDEDEELTDGGTESGGSGDAVGGDEGEEPPEASRVGSEKPGIPGESVVSAADLYAVALTRLEDSYAELAENLMYLEDARREAETKAELVRLAKRAIAPGDETSARKKRRPSVFFLGAVGRASRAAGAQGGFGFGLRGTWRFNTNWELSGSALLEWAYGFDDQPRRLGGGFDLRASAGSIGHPRSAIVFGVGYLALGKRDVAEDEGAVAHYLRPLVGYQFRARQSYLGGGFTVYMEPWIPLSGAEREFAITFGAEVTLGVAFGEFEPDVEPNEEPESAENLLRLRARQSLADVAVGTPTVAMCAARVGERDDGGDAHPLEAGGACGHTLREPVRAGNCAVFLAVHETRGDLRLRASTTIDSSTFAAVDRTSDSWPTVVLCNPSNGPSGPINLTVPAGGVEDGDLVISRWDVGLPGLPSPVEQCDTSPQDPLVGGRCCIHHFTGTETGAARNRTIHVAEHVDGAAVYFPWYSSVSSVPGTGFEVEEVQALDRVTNWSVPYRYRPTRTDGGFRTLVVSGGSVGAPAVACAVPSPARWSWADDSPGTVRAVAGRQLELTLNGVDEEEELELEVSPRALATEQESGSSGPLVKLTVPANGSHDIEVWAREHPETRARLRLIVFARDGEEHPEMGSERTANLGTARLGDQVVPFSNLLIEAEHGTVEQGDGDSIRFRAADGASGAATVTIAHRDHPEVEISLDLTIPTQ